MNRIYHQKRNKYNRTNRRNRMERMDNIYQNRRLKNRNYSNIVNNWIIMMKKKNKLYMRMNNKNKSKCSRKRNMQYCRKK